MLGRLEYKIRLRYSTILNFLAMIYRMAVAIGFAIIVARKLSIGDYGLWGIILSVSVFTALPVALWGTWAPRFLVRGWSDAPSTGLILTLIYWVPSSIVYIIISFIEEKTLGYGSSYMILGIPFMLLQSLDAYLGSLVNVVKPELRAHRSFIYETFRIALAYILVVSLGFGLKGAITAVEISLLIAVTYVFLELRNIGIFTLNFSMKLALTWIRSSIIPTTSVMANMLASGIRAFVSWIAGTSEPVAYLNIGLSAQAPLIQASKASVPALYARSLRRGHSGDVVETIRLFLFFSMYLTTTFIVLGKTIASLYNPIYIKAYLVIPVIAVYGLFYGIESIFEAFLTGRDKVDEKIENMENRKLMLSYLFKVPFWRLLTILSTYIISIPILLRYKNMPVEAAEGVGLALLVPTVILTSYLHIRSKKLDYSFPSKDLFAFLVSSIITSIYYIASGANSIIVSRFWETFPVLLFHLTVALVVYIVVSALISGWTRKLLSDSIKFLYTNIR